MKKIRSNVLILVMVLFTSLILVACGNNDSEDVEKAVAELNVEYQTPDKVGSVTKDVTLVSKVGEVTVTWESSNAAVISVTGKVTRQDADTAVTLTATLTKGEATDSKEFKLTVTAKEVTGPTDREVLDDLVAQYATTLDNDEFKATEDILLATSLDGKTITWTVVNGSDYFTNAGVVTRPSFTTGDVTVQLKAEIGVESKTFYFLIEKLEETDAEKIQATLNLVTLVSPSESGYQETNFATVATAKIDGVDVEVTWTSSDETLMTNEGNLVVFQGPDADVTLTASITYKGVTKTKAIEFSVKGVAEFDNIGSALVLANHFEKVFIKDVAVYQDITDGYYVISSDGVIAFVYGTRDNAKFPADTLVDIIATVDEYFGAYQLKEVSVVTVKEDGTVPTATHKAFTIAELTDLTLPSNATQESMFNHYPLVLENVKVYVKDAADKYGVFIVDKDFDPLTENISKANAIMIYYKSELDAIKALDGQILDSLKLVMAGYRSDKLVWYANYMDNDGDAVFTLTDAQKLVVAETAIASGIDAEYVTAETLDLPATHTDVTVAWTSSHPEYIATTGVITLPAAGAPVEVTLTATYNIGSETELVKEYKVTVGVPAVSTIEDVFYSGVKGSFYKITGVVTSISGNGTVTIQDATGAIAVFDSDEFDNLAAAIGKEVTLLGVRDDYRGLEQLVNLVSAVIGADATMPTAADIDMILEDEVELKKVQNQLVNLTNALVTKVEADSYGSTTVTLFVGGKTITMFWDNRILVTDNKLTALEVGDVIDVVGAPLSWKDNAFIGFSANAQIAKVTLTDAQKVAMDKAALALPEAFFGKETITLIAMGPYGSAITWAVDDAVTAVIADGVATFAEVVTDTPVVFTATLTSGAETDTKAFNVTVLAPPEITELFFSEYGEGGSGNNKWIEIYNGTSADVDLTGYVVKLGANGGVWGNTETLTGTLVSGDVLVLYNSDTSYPGVVANGDIQSTVCYFNGDDAVGLFKNDVLIDLFGVYGTDPGSSWPVGDATTANQTLVRNVNVYRPTTTWNAAEWDVHPDATDTFAGLHTATYYVAPIG